MRKTAPQYIPNPSTPAGRQPVRLVTDRAHRLRARKNVSGPRVCSYCGARNPRDVDHVDGREQNDAPENLTWACHSCNTGKGAHFARIGAGRRTRQYNPTRHGGAATLAEYTDVVATLHPEKFGGASSGKLTLTEAIDIMHATPPEDRAGFASELYARSRSTRKPRRRR